VTYYQQIGRAGRAVDDARVVLLNGREDDEIQDYFIRTALPSLAQSEAVLKVIEDSDGLTLPRIEDRVNISRGMLERTLKLLEVDEAVARQESRYIRTLNPWRPDPAHVERVTAQRYQELDRMQQYVTYPGCLFEFLARELDDPTAAPCGRCANCSGEALPTSVSPELVQEARNFLRGDSLIIEPRSAWPAGTAAPWRSAERRNAPGRALSADGDAGWGRSIAQEKYAHGQFGDDLVEAAAALVLEPWRPDPFPEWVTAVPSLRHPNLVPHFARRLAQRLRLPFYPVILKAREIPEQKTMQNSAQQMRNVAQAFSVTGACPGGPVLLVDDVVDSRWTMTVCGQLLRDAGSGLVYPLALASAAAGG
jgi:ATP-dependent DNA helicase RecQ